MKTAEVAARLLELCNAGKFDEAQAELYHDDIVSYEAMDMPGKSNPVIGKTAVAQKSAEWDKDNTIHGFTMTEPKICGDQFIVWMEIDCESAERGRNKDDEYGLYTVKDGKIIEERFFYV